MPHPSSLSDFECREFDVEVTYYSSFAYLIGAVRCATLAISSASKIDSQDTSACVIEDADSVIDGWSLHFPKTRKPVMTNAGVVDELVFQAHLLIHV